MPTQNTLAFDFGGESGRAVIGSFDGNTLKLNEVHRFPNKPVRIGAHLHWNVLSLFDEIYTGIRKAVQNHAIASVGVDTWGVDFALLEERGMLIGNPYHYRDSHTDTMMAEAFQIVPRADIFEATGAQFLQFNTIYQLLALQRTQPQTLRHASTLLMMPDLFHYWLTGVKASEFTDATTTQFYNPRTRDWARDLLDKLGIPYHFLAPIVQPGTVLGPIAKQTQRNLNVAGLENIQVITPATHDTGSAVAAVPASNNRYAYISSGTWSLMGIESLEPIINAQMQEFNMTNEGGVGSFRVLKNIMGLWLIQECRRSWTSDGSDVSYGSLMELAQTAAPLRSLVDPDDLAFLHPQDMPATLMDYCQRSGQPVPADRAALVRCALESLALKYRYTLDQLELLIGEPIEVIHVLGGGSQNTLLCQFTADACERPVLAGPVEATAIGNILVQMIAQKEFASLDEARAACRHSFPLTTYTPQHPQAWQDAYGRFKQLLRNPPA